MAGQDKYMNNTNYLISKDEESLTLKMMTQKKKSKCIYVPTFLIIMGI